MRSDHLKKRTKKSRMKNKTNRINKLGRVKQVIQRTSERHHVQFRDADEEKLNSLRNVKLGARY